MSKFLVLFSETFRPAYLNLRCSPGGRLIRPVNKAFTQNKTFKPLTNFKIIKEKEKKSQGSILSGKKL